MDIISTLGGRVLSLEELPQETSVPMASRVSSRIGIAISMTPLPERDSLSICRVFNEHSGPRCPSTAQ
jgi:hypothetical protein